MLKYIYQRVLIVIFISSIILSICGIWIDGFYTTRYDDVKIVKNIECCHNQYDNNASCRDLGRCIKFIYVRNDGIKDSESKFFHYKTDVDKQITSKKYNQLINEHIGYVTKRWVIALIILIILLSGFLLLPACIDNMDVKYDYCDYDSRDIALFRIKVFCWWKKFIGYNNKMINDFYEEICNKKFTIRCFSSHDTPYYTELQDSFNIFMNELV